MDSLRFSPVIILACILVASLVLAGCSAQDREEEPHPLMEELGLWDGWEIQITLMGGENETRHVFPSEEGHDFDRDGQDDGQEYFQGTDPNDADTSGNGLLDGGSITLSPEEHPAQEWIERGIVYKELDDGRLEFQGSFPAGVDPTMQDYDGDMIMDGEEVAGFDVWILGEPRRVTTDPSEPDTSGDGMMDDFKRDHGLDPSTRDTNGDGIPDHRSVNPWVDLEVRIEVEELDLSGGRDSALLRFQAGQGSQDFAVEEGAASSSPAIHVGSDGGHFAQGRHNTTFALTGLSEDGSRSVDLFSETVGSSSLLGAIHALTGDLSIGQGDERGPWPEDATFSGEDGSVTLRVVPVWPDEWQSCVDDGCRHGDGDFPWR